MELWFLEKTGIVTYLYLITTSVVGPVNFWTRAQIASTLAAMTGELR